MTHSHPAPAGHDHTEGDLNLSPNRAGWLEHLSDTTRAWLEEDDRYFLHQSLSTPCLNVLEECRGTTIRDLDGRDYLDFHGNCVHQAGFAHPRVIAAIKDQLDRLCFCTRRYTNRPAIELARKLTGLAPDPLKRILFAPGGTLVNGMALKLARAATGRFKVISFWDSFHGASLDMISLCGERLFRENAGPLLPGVQHVPPPDCTRCAFGCRPDTCTLQCADYIDYVMEKEGDVGALIAETIRGLAIFPPRDYWKRVRAICDQHGALLILDEIPHSLGRTGSFFTFQQFGIVPDMVTLGKGLGGGVFPLAALLARDDLNIMPDRALGHYTHEKNPVACRAALETIAIIEEERLAERAGSLGGYFKDELQRIAAGNPLVREVRGLGLMLGVELLHPEGTDATGRLTDAVMYQALRRGLSFKTALGRVLTLSPPLTVTRPELDRAVAILAESLEEAAHA